MCGAQFCFRECSSGAPGVNSVEKVGYDSNQGSNWASHYLVENANQHGGNLLILVLIRFPSLFPLVKGKQIKGKTKIEIKSCQKVGTNGRVRHNPALG